MGVLFYKSSRLCPHAYVHDPYYVLALNLEDAWAIINLCVYSVDVLSDQQRLDNDFQKTVLHVGASYELA